MKRWALGFLLLVSVLPAGAADRYEADRFVKGLKLQEQTAPAAPATNQGYLYAADNGSGTTLLYFKDSAGTATNLITANTGTSGIEFEGATADAYETTLNVVDPTADRAINLPNAAGVVVLSTLATNAQDAANSVWGASNALVFEGATANAYELSLAPADVTADRTVTFADMAGTVMISSLATNAADAANAVTGTTNGLLLEGATADGFETTVTLTDPTADRTITLPDLTGTVVVEPRAIDNDNNGQTVATTPNVLHTNAGAVGGGVWALPEASTVIGQTFCFVTIAAQNLDINPDNADLILALTNAAGDAIRNATAGNSICLTAMDATNWAATAIYGTWSDVN